MIQLLMLKSLQLQLLPIQLVIGVLITVHCMLQKSLAQCVLAQLLIQDWKWLFLVPTMRKRVVVAPFTNFVEIRGLKPKWQ